MSRLLLDGAPHDGPCPEIVRVPKRVAVCPECGGELLVQVCAWDTETMRPIRDEGIEVDCVNEPDPDDEDAESQHRWWQGEWMATLDKVRLWASRHLRVAR